MKNHVAFLIFYQPRVVGRDLRCIADANFSRVAEPLLKRKGAIVYCKEGTIESPVSKNRDVYSMNKTGGRMKML